jgi:hypothetical protein
VSYLSYRILVIFIKRKKSSFFSSTTPALSINNKKAFLW